MADSQGFPLTGVAYVARLEHEYMHSHKLSLCNTCFAFGWDKQMRRCNGCKLVDYCSRECQKKQWPKHKKFCNMSQGIGSKNAYFAGYDSEDAAQILIDSYRLRVETDHNHRGEDHGIYQSGKPDDDLVWAQGDAIDDFQRYLDLAEESGVLPIWWSFETRMQCLSAAVDKDNEENIFKEFDQAQLITRYGGDTTIRNALCMLAELIVGYDGKGAAKDNEWYYKFQEFLDLHPEERARLIQGAVEAVKDALEQQGKVLPQVGTEEGEASAAITS